MRLVQSGDAVLAVDDSGSHEAPTLLLLHAGNSTRKMWDSVSEALSEDHRVVRFDARGYGDSSPATARYSGSGDVITVLDALGIGRATLVGSSFGGQVVLDTALVEPDRVAGVVMIGASPRGAPFTMTATEQQLSDEIDAAEAAEDWDRRAELDVDVFSVGPTRQRDQVEPTFLAAAIRHAHEYVHLLRTQPNTHCEFTEVPAATRLHELTQPLLSIVGEHDLAAVQTQQERTIASIGPRAHAARISGAAHFPSIEQPEAVLDILRSWLIAQQL